MGVERFFEQAGPTGKWESWKEQNRGKSTPTVYQSGLDYFMRFHGLESLEELFELHLEAQRRGATDPLSKYIVAEMVKKAVNQRVNVEGKSGFHAKAIKSAVTKFLQLCGFEDFTVKLPRGILKLNGTGGSDIITPKQLGVVIGVARDLQQKALILTLKDAGLRLGDILALDYGDIASGLDSKADFFYLSRLTQKTGDRAQTVLGPEALNSLRDWIRYRRTRGEQITKDTPVFIKSRIGEGTKSKQNREKNIALKTNMRLTRNSASNIVSRLFSKAGFNTVTAHGLRKIHSTYLGVGEDRLSETMIARLEGKTIRDSREAYKIYAAEDLTNAYANNYHQIQVYGAETKMQETIKELRKQLAEINANKSTEVEELRQNMYRMQKSLEAIHRRDNERIARMRALREDL